MGLVIFLLIVGGILAYHTHRTCKENANVKEEIKASYKKEEGLDYLETFCKVKYIGGFKDIGYKNDITINLFEDRMRFNFGERIEYDVFKNKISNCRIENKTQIKNEISMGKILCLGVLAFGGNNKKEINKEYLVIDCEYNNAKLTIILEFRDQPHLEEASKSINNLINSNSIIGVGYDPSFE